MPFIIRTFMRDLVSEAKQTKTLGQQPTTLGRKLAFLISITINLDSSPSTDFLWLPYQ